MAKSVVVLGASADRSKYSNKAVRAYMRQGWKVFPVNPKGGEIEGLTAYTSVDKIGERIDRVTMYLPPAVGVATLPAIAAAKPEEFFVNPGAESDELVTKARELGLEPILACSIIEIGATPGQFPD
jgi:predicted CoA-binding protein